MKTSFHYQKWEGVTLPLIPVVLEQAGTFYAIVDSGANVSLFQPEIADLLGLKIKKGKRIPLSGIGGRIYGYLHTISLNIGGVTFACRVCFSEEMGVPINLLGREDFFKKFRITFDEAKQTVILEKNALSYVKP